tara:strand:+ start:290 stop:730 length:441 start_codon:yes stop_codon:yes gene_type:complete
MSRLDPLAAEAGNNVANGFQPDQYARTELDEAMSDSTQKEPTPFRAAEFLSEPLHAKNRTQQQPHYYNQRNPITHWVNSWSTLDYSDSNTTAQDFMDDVINQNYWDSDAPDPISGDTLAGYDTNGKLIQMRITIPVGAAGNQGSIG